MSTTFELIQSQAKEICNKAEYSLDLKVDEGVKCILDFINDNIKLLKPEDVTIKIGEYKEIPYVTIKLRILSFSIYDQCADFDKVSDYFNVIIKHYSVFNDSRTEKLFLDETIRVMTIENKIIFVQNDDTTPNRIEMEVEHDPEHLLVNPGHFIVKIYQAMN